MSWLALTPPPKEYSPRDQRELRIILEQAVNNLNEQNFPKGLSGSVLKERSIPGSALPLFEVHYTLHSATGSPFSTTSTTPVSVGNGFRWDPGRFSPGTWYFEADVAVADAAAAASVFLKGSDIIATITTSDTSLDIRRTAALAMPTTAQNLWVSVQTSNDRHAALLAGARLVFVPG